ncbi:DegT/DnrJ/EryC1/StrS family aminotransferase [bacterium]|nr:DegT/DnrJ/EryC1/StrS family aminotransferase [bacterium]
MIPILQLRTQYAQIQNELEEAVLRVLRSTSYILGQEVQSFEKEFATWVGTEYGVGVGNGTDAIQLAIRALDLKADDEVIVPSFTFVASAGAVALAGSRVVFADVDSDNFALNLDSLRRSITPKTKAVVAVHLYGHPAPIKEIKDICKEHNLYLIEDCAQSTGAMIDGQKVGTFGDMACFSFFPSKNLGGIGDGGMVLTSDPKFYETLQMLRGHGSKVRYYHEILGTNSRLDEVQAAALRVKSRHVDEWNVERRRVAHKYTELLQGTPAIAPCERPGCHHVYHQYTVRVPQRDKLFDYMRENGVGPAIYYPVCLHLQKTFASSGFQLGSLPICEKLQSEVMSLPMFPELTDNEIETVVSVIKSFFKV